MAISLSRWPIGPCIAATATIYGELSGTGKSDIMMKKLCALTILLISMWYDAGIGRSKS